MNDYGDDGPPPPKNIKKDLCGETNSTSEQQKMVEICQTKLLDLNDDCLLALISHLDVIHLSSFRRVCKRLKELAGSYFSRKYKSLYFPTLSKYQLISNQDAKDIFLTFGPMIKSMSVERKVFRNHEIVGYVEEILLKDIATHCGNTLLSLELKNFYFTESAVDSLNMLSDSLKSFSLDGSFMTDHCVLHLTNFTKLEDLTIVNTRDCTTLLETYPALKTLVLRNVRVTNECIVQHFIARHRQLESLKIESGDVMSSELFPMIAKYSKSLKKIDFCFGINQIELNLRFQNNISYLSELENLKAMRLQCYSRSIGNLLTKMVSNKIAIKILDLEKGIADDETIAAIMQMKDLFFLRFHQMRLTNEYLIKLANELPKLQELHIFSEPNITTSALIEVLRVRKQLTNLWIDKFCLDLKLYNDILDIVKERRNGKLEINIYSTHEQVFVPQETIRMNKNWIVINFKRTLPKRTTLTIR